MDPQLKTIYDRELQHLESHAREFSGSQRYQRIASRLGLGETTTVRDPFVEWLLEGFAFLAARVQRKIDQEFPRLTQNLLSVAYPHLTAPTPSMIVAAFEPDSGAKNLLDGPIIRRGLPVKARAAGRAVREVRFVTGRSVRLWPLRVEAAEFLAEPAAVRDRVGEEVRAGCGVSLRLELTVDGALPDCAADELDLFLSGPASVTMPLFEALTGRLAGAFALGGDRARRTQRRTPLRLEPLGFARDHRVEGGPEEADALLPYGPRSYDGYRLLQEFFALRERFLFLRLSGLARAFAAAEGKSIEIVFAIADSFPELRGRIDAKTFRPYCAPAVNLFPKEMDDIRLTNDQVEHHVIPDRGAPTDYEVHSILSVVGHGARGERQEFLPFFSTPGLGAADPGQRFYAVSREPRARPVTHKGDPRLGEYRGGEAYVSLVDEACAPYSSTLERLSVTALCTNRHLPLLISGEGLQLTAEEDLGCDAVRVVAGPSEPRPGLQEGRRLWDAVSHLSLNYLSLVDTENGGGAEAMRQLLRLYAPQRTGEAQRLVDALAGTEAGQIFGRIETPGGASAGAVEPIGYGRGLEIRLRFDKEAEAAPLLCAVLERFLAGYVSINSFTQTVLVDDKGQERCRWPTRSGARPVL